MVLLLISILSPLIPLVTGYRQARRNPLWWYALICILSDTSIFIVKRALHLNFAWIANLFVIAELFLFIMYFKSKVFRKNTLLYYLLFASFLFFTVHTSLTKGWFIVNRTGISVLLGIYMLCCIAGFYKILKEQKILHLEQSSLFWSNVAILIYASGAFFLFLVADTLRAENKVAMGQLWGTLFLSLNILKNILLGIALSKKEET